MNPLDLIPNSILYEQYSDPRGGIDEIARMYGVTAGTVYGRLKADPAAFLNAQAIKAYRLHELSVQALYEEPERIADANGNLRIDPSSVALLKYRSMEAARIAGILESKLSERHQVEVTHNETPLADYIASIAAKGSTIPIAAPHTVEGETVTVSIEEMAAAELDPLDPLEQPGIPLE